MTQETKLKIVNITNKYFALHPNSSIIGALQLCIDAFPEESEDDINEVVRYVYEEVKERNSGIYYQ